MPDGSSQVKRGRKFDQVLKGARDVFMADGFEGASVDDIAKAAQVSKATLYSYFPDKKLLFMEVARHECNRQAEMAMDGIAPDTPIRDALTDMATQLLDFITSPFGQRMFRICVGESDRFPQLGREFYESGPKLVHDRLVAFISEGVTKGVLAVDDVPLAADQFAELCKADIFPRMVFSMASTFSKAEKDRVVIGAVDMFMARYAVRT
ncbi:TetR/AcrR family transcriptional regulator [Yoonia sp. 208BN28-4]|uniref:TetR/AcrR family transcriptional regulator n=1 Tax=Yoonia sp. 208BN28-4 TaxID=3126505 RepID=UPI0030B3FD2D